MAAGKPDKGINDPVVEELPWHPRNPGREGRIFPDIQGEDEVAGLEPVSAVLSRITQRTRRFVRGEKFADSPSATVRSLEIALNLISSSG